MRREIQGRSSKNAPCSSRYCSHGRADQPSGFDFQRGDQNDARRFQWGFLDCFGHQRGEIDRFSFL